MMRRRRLAPPIELAAALFLAGCGGVPDRGLAPAEAPPPTRGYILISFDTLRADHLGAYGYQRPTSPFLDRLARRGTLFEQAIVQYPSTLTSHMSIFTGLYPREHGVYPPQGVLSSEIETLPEVFQRHGFRTAGFTEGGFMRGRFGFRRGFDEFKARDRQGLRDVEATFGRGLRFLESLAEDERFFLFLHTYAVHAPYDPPPSHRGLFWKEPAPEGAFAPNGPNLARHNAEGGSLDGETLAYFEALYDETIRHADAALEKFFAGLKALRLDEQVTVILTSDHGEEFQDHGLMNHTQLYHETLHVPLLILHPERLRERRHPGLVESVDLAPTLYHLARVGPAEAPSGRSLAPLLGQAARETGPENAATAYAEAGGGRRALYREGPSLLHHLLTFEPAPGSWRAELYEVLSDPAEKNDLSAVPGSPTRPLVRELRGRRWQPRTAPESQELDPETESRLKALGYLQ